MAKRTHGVYDRCEYDIRTVTRLPAGLYTVSKDIENPNFDKRSSDFNRLPVIEAGTRVLVKDRDVVSVDDTIVSTGSKVSKLGDRASHCIEVGYFCYEPLMAALVPVEQVGTEDYLTNLEHQHGYSACAEWVLQRLLINSIVTREQVEAAVAANNAAPDEN